ncbi:hypothetical protein E4T02_14410 [Listeria monocytogenes]|uniref:hypothetical protein n=1 Tax=Listeria immobilis TaxID=2713502 RepID=UPI0010B8242C|nr:hypothetical protein [Listeria immobilis]EAE3734145.1 hypothetical protein [Listeria monocytogenes]EAE3749692.1 hypothetical protein [Listeria monocytogenes]EAE5773683.1 hypothetical protein [Listeria monocytogenes]EAE6178226.1 hypothetical protein [Listeria monocytogenes]EAE6181287.1 hypothetical protein [Listeria monocytogenes]
MDPIQKEKKNEGRYAKKTKISKRLRDIGRELLYYVLLLLFITLFSLVVLFVYLWLLEQSKEIFYVYQLSWKYFIEAIGLTIVGSTLMGICLCFILFTPIHSIIRLVVRNLLCILVFVLVGRVIFHITPPIGIVQYILTFIFPLSMMGLCFFWKYQLKRSKEKSRI